MKIMDLGWHDEVHWQPVRSVFLATAGRLAMSCCTRIIHSIHRDATCKYICVYTCNIFCFPLLVINRAFTVFSTASLIIRHGNVYCCCTILSCSCKLAKAVLIKTLLLLLQLLFYKFLPTKGFSRYYYLRQGGYVFAAFCLSVCLCVRKITQKVMDRSFWNFEVMSGMAQTTSDSILGVIRKESWILDHFEIFVTIALKGV